MLDRPIIDWPAWAASPRGRYVLAWEQAQLDQVVCDIFGYHAVQLGLPQLDTLRENRMPCRTLALDVGLRADTADKVHKAHKANMPMTLAEQAHRNLLWCDLPALPFEEQSIDLLLLPHVLELTSDPHALLREAARVLRPEGQLVIVGFNSFSLWSIRQSLGRIINQPFMPAAHDLIAFTRLKDWLKLLGFELSRGCFGCYRLPFSSERWLKRCAFMEQMGERWWPVFGAVYIVTAIKRTLGLRLIGAPVLQKPALVPALLPAATS